METATFGKRDFLRPTLVLIEEHKEDILREWLENGQTERVTSATGETAEEIGRDFLSAVISDIGTVAGEKFRMVGADVLAKCFHDLKRSAVLVLEGIGSLRSIHRAFDEGLVAILSAHATATENLTKEYRRAVDASALVSTTDPMGVITHVNERFCEASGYSREELIGKPHSIVRHPDVPSSIFAEMWSVIKSKNVWRGILKNRRKDGSSYRVSTTISPILGLNGEIREYVSIRWEIPESGN